MADDLGPDLCEIVSEMSSSDQNHRRKRGDTIRASDFSRPAIFKSASALPPRTEAKRPATAASATSRTRSGTVTLAKPPTAGKAKTSRRGKLPTVPMKILDEPLPPQGSDEEDDELLLKRGVYWRDEDY